MEGLIVAPWSVRCRSGVYLDLLHPTPDQIVAQDIAHGLARACRFGGQVELEVEDRWYSVAEHCCHAAGLAEQSGEPVAIQLACLLHDAPEAYIGDLIRPLRRALSQLCGGLSDMAILQIENAIMAAICSRFGFDGEDGRPEVDVDHPAVRRIDESLLHAERARLFTPDGVSWGTPPAIVGLPANIGWSIFAAEREWLERFDRLVRQLRDES